MPVVLLAAASCPPAEKPVTVAPREPPAVRAAEVVEAPPAAAPAVTFAQVQPLLQRCQPCHFPGGKMYGRLPFDRPETVRLLGEKLFSRIKDESERQLIRDFLKQPPG